MNPKNQLIKFRLNISYEQYLRVYQGSASNVSVVSEDGRRIAFPARNIQPFLDKQGIEGLFEMEISPENKFIRINKLS